MSLRNYKVKQDTTTHLLEWLKSKQLKISNTQQEAEEQVLLVIADFNLKKNTVTIETGLYDSMHFKSGNDKKKSR